MDLRKAAEMAIEAIVEGGVKKQAEAVYELRRALSHPIQTPVAYVSDDGASAAIVLGIDLEKLTPLYIAPPKREWVGLTEEEFFDLLNSKTRFNNVEIPLIADVIRETQAKLKEKNS